MALAKKGPRHTYTVHGHFRRPDGRLEAFWTRTGLTKSAAEKLAREQRRESGGVAEVVVEEGPAYGARKKSPAQLDREIAEVLSRAPGRGDGKALVHHATKTDRRKIRYVHLAWSNPQSAYPSQRHVEGNYPESNVTPILEGLFQSGIPEVHVEGRDFRLSSLDNVYEAASYARGHLEGRRRRSAHATAKSELSAEARRGAVRAADAQIAPTLGKTPAQLVRAINAIVRAADGRNVYLITTRLGTQDARRVVGARTMPGTKGGGLDVRLLDTGRWHGVLAEMGDRIEVR